MGKSPLKMSGVVMTAAFILVLIVGIAFLPGGGVASLVSAFAMATGFAGTGYGILQLVRSGGAAERARATAVVDRAERQRRARRSLRAQSVVLLAFGIVIAAMVPLLDGAREGTVLRFGFLSIGLIVLGIGGWIVAARAGHLHPEIDSPPESFDAAARDDDPAPEGWQLVTRRDLASIIMIAAPGAGLLLFMVWQSSSLLLLSARTMSRGVAVGAIVIVIAVVVGTVIVVLRRAPQVWIDVPGRRVRSGSRTVTWDEITAARLSGTAAFVGGTRSLVLNLEGADKLRIPLLLRRRGKAAMTETQCRAALALVEGASIAVPRAPEDPTGRFSKVNYPSHLDAAQARSLVARPPRSDEDLPVPIG